MTERERKLKSMLHPDAESAFIEIVRENARLRIENSQLREENKKLKVRVADEWLSRQEQSRLGAAHT